MIQRIQTVFLFAALILIGLLFFIPYAGIVSANIYSLSLMGISSVNGDAQIQQPYWLTAAGVVESILILITIFLFKNRKLQMKLTLLAMLAALILNGAMFFVFNNFTNILAGEPVYKVLFVFPVAAAILLFLAYRSINKDELLIKSLDRLR
jgi:hypothetical protein